MIGLLLWILGALVLAIEITSRHLWRELAAAMLGAGFVLWFFGGLMLFSLRGIRPLAQPKPPALSPELRGKIADFAKQQRDQASGVGK